MRGVILAFCRPRSTAGTPRRRGHTRPRARPTGQSLVGQRLSVERLEPLGECGAVVLALLRAHVALAAPGQPAEQPLHERPRRRPGVALGGRVGHRSQSDGVSDPRAGVGQILPAQVGPPATVVPPRNRARTAGASPRLHGAGDRQGRGHGPADAHHRGGDRGGRRTRPAADTRRPPARPRRSGQVPRFRWQAPAARRLSGRPTQRSCRRGPQPAPKGRRPRLICASRRRAVAVPRRHVRRRRAHATVTLATPGRDAREGPAAPMIEARPLAQRTLHRLRQLGDSRGV